jgi:hypothetical protein
MKKMVDLDEPIVIYLMMSRTHEISLGKYKNRYYVYVSNYINRAKINFMLKIYDLKTLDTANAIFWFYCYFLLKPTDTPSFKYYHQEWVDFQTKKR